MKNFKKIISNVGLGLVLFSSVGLTGINAQSNHQSNINTTFYTSKVTNMYDQSGKNVVTLLGKDTPLKTIGQKDANLIKVDYNHHKGYVYKNELSSKNNSNNNNQTNKNIINHTSKTSNVYEQNGKDVLAVLGKDFPLKVLHVSKNSNLVEIQYNNFKGYVYKDILK